MGVGAGGGGHGETPGLVPTTCTHHTQRDPGAWGSPVWQQWGPPQHVYVSVMPCWDCDAAGGCLQVARKLVILEGDLERSEERAEVAEA